MSPEAIKRVLDKPTIWLMLAGLYPAAFSISVNWYIFTEKQILFLVLVTPIFSVAMGVAAFLLVRSVFYLLPESVLVVYGSKLSKPKFKNIAAPVAVFVLILLEYFYIRNIFPSKIWVIAIAIVMIVVAPWFSRFRGRRIVVGIVFCLTCLSLVAFLVRFSQAEVKTTVDHNKFHEKVNLVNRPNIYLVVLESYQSSDTLRKVHGIDNSAFENQLESQGFRIASQFLSNYYATLQSLSSLFLMEHHYYRFTVGEKDSFAERLIIGGGDSRNKVFRILKNNDYLVQFFLPSTYSFFPSSEVDYIYPSREIWNVYRIFQSRPLDVMIDKLKTMFPRGDSGYLANVDEGLKRAQDSERPVFTFIKARHTNHFAEQWNHIDRDQLDYEAGIHGCNEELLPIIKRIRKEDEAGIVILIGDHGVWKTRDSWLGSEDVNSSLRESGFRPEEVAEDIFSTFFAIAPSEYMPKSATSHVNLFAAIFSQLGGFEIEKAEISNNESYLLVGKKVYVTARDGVPLGKWEEHTVR